MLGSDRFDSANRRRLSGSALRTFTTICDLWGLKERERLLILGLLSRSVYQDWTRAAHEHRAITLSVDVLTHIFLVLGIHAALGVLHRTEAEGIAWLKSPHSVPTFGGHPPMSRVTSGTQDGLQAVQRFLDAARSGFYMAPNGVHRMSRPTRRRGVRLMVALADAPAPVHRLVPSRFSPIELAFVSSMPKAPIWKAREINRLLCACHLARTSEQYGVRCKAGSGVRYV